jgi:uncharacterized protein (TIGR03790 family)
MLRISFCAAVVCLALGASPAQAQTGANVLVVANGSSPDSVAIADYYAEKRGVPPDQLVKLQTSTADQVSRVAYERSIQAPIAAWLARHGAQDRILFIVLTKGVPLRIAGTGGRQGTVGSVDSELALLYRRMTGQPVAPTGFVPNPLFLEEGAVAGASRFTHNKYDIYLVTRLDGFTVDDVKALIDRGAAPSSSGRILLDQRAGLEQQANEWLAAAAKKLNAQGLAERVMLEETSRVIEPQKGVLGYFSWGSNDPAISERHPGHEFVPGALAGMFVSSDARTFTEPPATWKPGRWESRMAYYAASPQSLTGDLIRAGVTGAAGYVAEPYLDSSVRPDLLFPAYLAGFTLAESFYMALPALSWQAVVIGDPICRPFGKSTIAAADLDPPIDKETELPAFFSTRRLAQAVQNTEPAAAKHTLRAEARLARDDRQAARAAFEEAIAVDGKHLVALQNLGSLYELDGDHEKAIAIYRKILDINPKDPAALNNLAYALAVREDKPAEALPLAERALLLAPRNPVIADTVGWIKYLLEDYGGAIKLLEPAAKALPGNAEVQFHAAAAYAAAGRVSDAANALKAAEALDPNIKERPDYQALVQKIGK